jgi:hypothetical protein
MSAFENLQNFDEQTMQTIAFNMCKWFDFEAVNINYAGRANVESGIWITIKIEYKAKTFYIDGQRNDIVKRRLIEWLRNHIQKIRS